MSQSVFTPGSVISAVDNQSNTEHFRATTGKLFAREMCYIIDTLAALYNYKPDKFVISRELNGGSDTARAANKKNEKKKKSDASQSTI